MPKSKNKPRKVKSQPKYKERAIELYAPGHVPVSMQGPDHRRTARINQSRAPKAMG